MTKNEREDAGEGEEVPRPDLTDEPLLPGDVVARDPDIVEPDVVVDDPIVNEVTPSQLLLLGSQPKSRFFHTPDGEIFDYREATAMGIYRLWLSEQYDKVNDLFAYFQSRKINAIRPLFNLSSAYWKDRHRHNSHLEGNQWWDQLVPFITQASNYGIYTRLCLFGGVESFTGEEVPFSRPDVISDNENAITQMREYVDQFVTMTRDLPVLYEIANEPGQIGFGSNSRTVIELGEQCKSLAPDRLMNFGAATDEDSIFYCRAPADFLDEHLARHEEWDYQASVKRLIEHHGVDQTQMPFISGEWMNLGNVKRPGNSDADGSPSTATAFATSAMLRVKRAIPAFHAHCLLWGDVPDTATDLALQAWSRGLDLIPINFSGQGCNGHWDCSPFDASIFPPTEETTDDWYGPVRIFGLDGPQGYLAVSIREPIGYELYGDHRPIETLHLEKWGDWQSRIVRA